MCTWLSGVESRNDERWHFAITFGTIPPWQASTRDSSALSLNRCRWPDPASQERYAAAKGELVERIVALAIAEGYGVSGGTAELFHSSTGGANTQHLRDLRTHCGRQRLYWSVWPRLPG
jgi:hypothetical protein